MIEKIELSAEIARIALANEATRPAVLELIQRHKNKQNQNGLEVSRLSAVHEFAPREQDGITNVSNTRQYK
jgi:hypothetical protein